MKKEAIRYAKLLETGCFITHQEQDEIAKLLRRLAMTEDEAWDELEAKLNKQNKEKPITDRETLQIAFNALVEIDRQTPYPIAKHAIQAINKAFNTAQDIEFAILAEREQCANHYLGIMRDAVEQAVLREREACAKLCESMGVHPALNVYNGGPEWYQRQKECAAAIRARGDKHE